MKRVSVSDILKNTYTCLPFEGLVKSVIGTPAPNAQMMIYGSPGSQKSTFIIAMCAYLQTFGKVCYKALEEGESLTFQEKLKRVGDVFDPKKVILEDEILGQKGEFAPYSFVVIDSATVIGIDATHIAAMKKAYPNTMFIYVYQCTKDGKFRGSNEIEHEVDIALRADKGTIKQQKNRCGGVEDCTVQEMIDFAQAKSKPISGFLGNVGKIEDDGDVPGLSRVDTYWRRNKPQSLFDFDNQKIHRGTDIDAKYKYLFGETEENGFADIEEAAKTLRSDFGIQGFEFGKWTTEEDRINYLKATTITLSDIAYLLGFKKIGLSKLSICFGSRGVPRASGHFQPNELYINLSRYDRDNSFKSLEGTARKEAYIKAIASRGLPSLVHEFGHFVDCMAANIQGVRGLASGDYRASFLQNGYSVGEFGAKIDEIILAACGKNGNITTYGARLIAQDTQKDNDGNDVVVPYFQLRAEVFARIFEKWAAVKLKQNGFFNIFFTKLKHNTDDVSGNVYLTNKEFEDVQPLMDSFIAKYADAVKGNERVVSIKKKAKTKVEVKPQPKPEPEPKAEVKPQPKPEPKPESKKMPEVKVGQRWSLRQTLQATKGKSKTFEDIIIISKIEDNKIFYKTENEGTGFVSYSRFQQHFNEGDAKLLSEMELPKIEVGQKWWLRQSVNQNIVEATVTFTELRQSLISYKNSDNTGGSISYVALAQLIYKGDAKLLQKAKKPTQQPQSQKAQTKSEDKADLDQVYRLPLNTIHTDVKRFQNRDTEFSQQSVDRIVSNFDANKLDPIVVWKDPSGKIFVLSGHSRFQAHKQLKKATIPARYFQGTEAEAKEFSRVHANRAATSEGLMADIRAFKYQRDELKRTKTDLQKEWANYHKLEAYSFLNPKGKFLENLESKASGSFPYLEMRAQWVGNLRKSYPLLTNLHENECFEYLYFDKKGSEIDKDSFINAVQTQASRLDFDPEKPLKLGKKTGTDARADTAEAQARIREIDLELKDYAAKRRVANTQEEKQAIDKFLNRLRQEREIIEKNLNIVIKTQNALFGVDEKNYMFDLAKKAKKQKSYNVGDYVLIKSTWGDQCFLPAKITKLGYYTDLNVLTTIKRRVVQLNFDKMKVATSQIVGKITVDEYRAAMERYKLVVENAMPILPLPINWVNNFTISSPENSTLFGVKGKETQLTPFIAIAKRLVNDLGKKQHCETENVLPYNIATSVAKVIKEYPNLEKEIVDSLKKAYKKEGKITKDSWQNIKNKGLNLALFGVKK